MHRRDSSFAINSLADLFSEFLSLVIQLRQLRDFGDPADLRRQCKQLVLAAEAKGRRLDMSKMDVDDAKFAVIALLDEVVLNSDWFHKEEWSSQPLQLEFFGTNLAGEEFFTRLEGLMREQPGRFEVIEVYYLCLTLGFEGKYRVMGRDRLRTLIGDVCTRMQAIRPFAASLSPHWQREAVTAATVISQVPLWMIPALTLALLIVLLIFADGILGWQLTDFVKEGQL